MCMSAATLLGVNVSAEPDGTRVPNSNLNKIQIKSKVRIKFSSNISSQGAPRPKEALRDGGGGRFWHCQQFSLSLGGVCISVMMISLSKFVMRNCLPNTIYILNNITFFMFIGFIRMWTFTDLFDLLCYNLLDHTYYTLLIYGKFPLNFQ